jgi:adenosylmethionine-8-amino-7-oxononanoate aminotransferase
VYLMPPYILNDKEIADLGNTTLKVFNQVLGEFANGVTA